MDESRGESGQQKTERFNMFMSVAEMQAIDDWAWRNRIRSKSEAVRRLVDIGLRLESQLIDLENFVERLISTQDRVQNMVNEVLEIPREDRLKADVALKMATLFLAGLQELDVAATPIGVELSVLLNAVLTMKKGEVKFPEIKQEADKFKAALDQFRADAAAAHAGQSE